MNTPKSYFLRSFLIILMAACFFLGLKEVLQKKIFATSIKPKLLNYKILDITSDTSTFTDVITEYCTNYKYTGDECHFTDEEYIKLRQSALHEMNIYVNSNISNIYDTINRMKLFDNNIGDDIISVLNDPFKQPFIEIFIKLNNNNIIKDYVKLKTIVTENNKRRSMNIMANNLVRKNYLKKLQS